MTPPEESEVPPPVPSSVQSSSSTSTSASSSTSASAVVPAPSSGSKVADSVRVGAPENPIRLPGTIMESSVERTDSQGQSERRRSRAECLREKYRLLTYKSAILQTENEELLNKLTDVRAAVRRGRKYRMLLIQKLDSFGDNWRSDMVKDSKIGCRSLIPHYQPSVSVATATGCPASRLSTSLHATSILTAPVTSTSYKSSNTNINSIYGATDQRVEMKSEALACTGNAKTHKV